MCVVKESPEVEFEVAFYVKFTHARLAVAGKKVVHTKLFFGLLNIEIRAATKLTKSY